MKFCHNLQQSVSPLSRPVSWRLVRREKEFISLSLSLMWSAVWRAGTVGDTTTQWPAVQSYRHMLGCHEGGQEPWELHDRDQWWNRECCCGSPPGTKFDLTMTDRRRSFTLALSRHPNYPALGRRERERERDWPMFTVTNITIHGHCPGLTELRVKVINNQPAMQLGNQTWSRLISLSNCHRLICVWGVSAPFLSETCAVC